MASGADRISNLPEDILNYILSLLPAQDAVRPCILAQSWRNRWRSAPALRFACSTNWNGGVDAFGHFVDSLLRVRRRVPPLDSCDFDLDADLASCDLDLDEHGSKWIHCVLELKVRELRFRISENPDNQFMLGDMPFSSQHLTSLELKGVTDPYDMLDLSESPSLESLKMEECFMSIKMHSPRLKNLSIKYRFFGSECRTRMSFPNLVSFEFVNNSGRVPMLERMPHLEAAKIQLDRCHYNDCRKHGRLDDCGDAACEGCFSYYGPDDSGSLFLHGLADATYLNLSAYPDMYVFSRDLKWFPAFNKLKTLVLSNWFLSTDLCALIWFLHHTPLLEKLTLEILKPCKTLMKTVGSYNPFEKSIAPSHLLNVEIISNDVDGIVLKVLKVLNANGIPLEKIRIQCSGYDFSSLSCCHKGNCSVCSIYGAYASTGAERKLAAHATCSTERLARAHTMVRGADRISALPEAILHHILSLLSAQDAVRTCVLAQSWRNHWRSAPAVRITCSEVLLQSTAPFVDGLLRARRRAPSVDSCDIDLDQDPESWNHDLDNAGNRWIRDALELRVRELRFRASGNPDYAFAWESWRPLVSQQLTSLELTGVQLDAEVLAFPECPTLQSLKLEASPISSLDMQSSSVKRLSIKNCSFDSEYRTWMSFPCLVSLEFTNNSGRAPMLERMPQLEAAKVQFDCHYADRCKNGRLHDCGDAACGGCFSYYGHGEFGSLFLHGLAEATYLNLSAYPDMGFEMVPCI